MPGFVTQTDIVEAGGVTSASLQPAIATALPPALNTALPPALAASSRQRLTEVSIRDLGCVPGQSISAILNAAIANADPGTVFIVPGLSGASDGESWLMDEPIVFGRSAIALKGQRYRGKSGSVLRRTGAFQHMFIEGAGGGTAADQMIARILFSDLVFHGNDVSFDLVRMRYVGVFGFDRCLFTAPGFGRLLNIDRQTQDGYWRDCYFENGGTDDGTVAAIEVDDSAGSNDGHNQNLLWDNCTSEAYNGTAFSAFGKGTGPGNSLIQLQNFKAESPFRSGVPDIRLSQAVGCTLNMRQLVGRGRAPGDPRRVTTSKTSMAEFTSCERINFSAVVEYISGGVPLERIVDASGSIKSNVVIRANSTQLINNLTSDHVVRFTVSTGNTASCDNLGTAGAQKRVTSATQVVVESGITREVNAIDAVYQRVRRTDAAGVVQASVRVQEIINPTTTRYFGFDANNNVAGGDVLNIGSAPRWILDNSPTGLSYFGNGMRVGSLTTGPMLGLVGNGSPEGVVTATYGSEYINLTTTAGAGARKWFKATATGNTGWVAEAV